jgi:hypothetical protein
MKGTFIGYESVNVREEYKLRLFEIRVLRRIFGPKRDEVKGGGKTAYRRAS